MSRAGSIDWCCLPRFDSDSCFGRLLDWEKGGYFAVCPTSRSQAKREYLGDSLILVTTYRSGRNSARVTDFFSMRAGGRRRPRRELVRVIEGVRGCMRLRVHIAARFDCGEVKPWVYPAGARTHFAVGSNAGLRVYGNVPLEIRDEHDLVAEIEVRPRQRLQVALQFFRPEEAHTVARRRAASSPRELRAHYAETLNWWRQWSSKIVHAGGAGVNVVRSAITLKALTYAPTGAIVAAPTTSLPEWIGGERNWDYRYCWIRDSIFTVWALNDSGAQSEADGVRRFIQRSAAGNADELQVLYGVDGKRRLTEISLDQLEGWRGSSPVRIGNAAEAQFQADMYGMIVELSWRWSLRGHRPAPAYWAFLTQIIQLAIEKWPLPDRGIWEVRSKPLHFVHSKVMCWAAVNRGIALAEKFKFQAPLQRWREARDRMRLEIESRGIDHRRGIFVRSYGSREVDASALLLPTVDFVAHEDERMVRTADAIRRELTRDGLLLRYKHRDGLEGAEGVFLACTFWLAECLARQGRRQLAQRIFRRACRCANELGLFAEQYSPQGREMLGNFPQGLTHLAHITAALALDS